MNPHYGTGEDAEVYLNSAKQQLAAKKYDKALEAAQNAVEIYKNIQDHKNYVYSLNVQGVICAAMGNEGLAMDSYLLGIDCAIQYNQNNMLHLFYNNVGTRYQELGDHATAIHYFIKSEKELLSSDSEKEERFPVWCLITYLNMLHSSTELGKYETALEYLEKAEKIIEERSLQNEGYSTEIEKCALYMHIGKTEYVREHIDEIIAGIPNDESADLTQNMQSICTILKGLCEYDKWKRAIMEFAANIPSQKSVYYECFVAEKWMEFYETIHDDEAYIKSCVRFAELSIAQRELNKIERLEALNIKIELKEKEKAHMEAVRQSRRDQLTDLGNRYMLEYDIEGVRGFLEQKKGIVGFGIIDIDFFKEQNDTYGHATGDKCLRKVAGMIEAEVGNYGEAYRFGGDEFILLLKVENEEKVRNIAENIRRKIKYASIPNENTHIADIITISQGYAVTDDCEKCDYKSLIDTADHELYNVKHSGKDNYRISRL